MNKIELIEVLTGLANKDLAKDSSIDDHPCMVAVRAIDQCFDDIGALKDIVEGRTTGKSKRCQVLVKTPTYNPAW